MSGRLQTKLPSPQERLELILIGLSRRRPIKELCLEAHVSRELFYRWMGRVHQAGLRALEARAPGPKERGLAKPEEEVAKLRVRLEALEAKSKRLRKDKQHLELMVKSARRTIRRRGWAEARASKKNSGPA